jgi:hypothetical protein
MPLVTEVIKVGNGELLIKAQGRGRRKDGTIGPVPVFVHAQPTKQPINKGDEVNWHQNRIMLVPKGSKDKKAIMLDRHFPAEQKKKA